RFYFHAGAFGEHDHRTMLAFAHTAFCFARLLECQPVRRFVAGTGQHDDIDAVIVLLADSVFWQDTAAGPWLMPWRSTGFEQLNNAIGDNLFYAHGRIPHYPAVLLGRRCSRTDGPFVVGWLNCRDC